MKEKEYFIVNDTTRELLWHGKEKFKAEQMLTYFLNHDEDAYFIDYDGITLNKVLEEYKEL